MIIAKTDYLQRVRKCLSDHLRYWYKAPRRRKAEITLKQSSNVIVILNVKRVVEMILYLVRLCKRGVQTGRLAKPGHNRIAAETMGQNKSNRDYADEYKDSEKESSKYEARCIQKVGSNSVPCCALFQFCCNFTIGDSEPE